MNKKVIFIYIILFVCSHLISLPISISVNEINLGHKEINQSISQDVFIKNVSDITQDISVSRFLSNISLSDSLFTISPQDSVLLNITFTGETNINYSSVIIFKNQINNLPLYLPFNADCYLINNEYPATFNLFDDELKDVIFTLIDGHTSLGYQTARTQMFTNIDNDNGTVECIYTGFLHQTTIVPDANIMNTEHVWPQSLGATPAIPRSDLNHLFPTESNANNIRGNLPFGTVTGNPNWERGGSKRGIGNQGTTVFEPRDSHKGVIARAMIYFAIRYNNPSQPFFNLQENIMKEWNRDYLPNTKEKERNLLIGNLQGKKNPFIVHPAFADRIFSIAGTNNRPDRFELVFPDNITINELGIYQIPFFNNGNKSIQIQNVLYNTGFMEGLSFPNEILPKEFGFLKIEILRGFPEEAAINIHTNAQIYLISINYETTKTMDIINELENSFYIFPNPVRNNFQIISKQILNESTLTLYNIRGQKILTQLIRDNEQNISLPTDLTSGIYFVKIEHDDSSSFQRLIYLK